jgi:DNA-binding winged helix-turn-helix (wHTH) protein/TolB-like protein
MVRFGPFVFDPATGDLAREGRPVRLQPQPARVLAALVARPGDLVTREELRAAVWADGTFVDFERGLNFCIAQIRAALRDTPESPRYIQTVPRRGYRFIAPVGSFTAEPTAPSGATAGPSSEPIPRRMLIAGGLAVALLCVVSILAARGYGDQRIRVAVVPFDNETGDQAYANLAQGIADQTVARLASPQRVDRLAVVGNSAQLRRPRAFRDLKAIGDSANVEYVVLAQVRRDESRVRLIAHLIRVRDEAHVWAQTYDRAEFSLGAQAEIAEAIAGAVTARLLTVR